MANVILEEGSSERVFRTYCPSVAIGARCEDARCTVAFSPEVGVLDGRGHCG